MNPVKNWLAKTYKRMKFIANILKKNPVLSTLILVAALLVASGIYFSITRVKATTPDWDWANQIGNSGVDRGKAVAKDDAGNVYVAGDFEGSVTIGTTVLTSAGDKDVFIAKYDGDGNVDLTLNPFSIGGSGAEGVNGIAVDSSDNIYITGSFEGTSDFDTTAGTSNLVSSGL